ncbi:P-loop NTPase fold protein [Escherichia coli]|uniref:P-loop NTPase fold protein n=1 Tax=Escherichia coli TaxID=562 RepID=UPI00197BFB3B|nr:P-loop NTPase fold protein [Escherichia coli]
MSLKSTKEQLKQLLTEKDNKVIALSGKWGTGKSYMWQQVKNSSADETVKGALYASLFGLSGIEQVKTKLIQSMVPAIKANPKLWEGAKQTVKSGVKVLEGFHKGFGALNDLNLVFAPAILRQKLIVLDDIERKHEKLDIDEVLGFIDEFTQQHGCRFVLILNSDQLAKRDVWDLLREKVVDQEIRLTTSSTEAFDIAIGYTASGYAEQIRTSVVSCGVTNIRIISKIIKVVNRILGERQELTNAVLWRVIPSTVLLAAIHYKGIEDGPDFDFVLTQDSENFASFFDSKEEVATAESKQHARWRKLISELKILQCDDYELLVVEFLQSGLFDVSLLTQIIDRYVDEADVSEALHAVWNFFEQYAWNHKLTDEQLLSQAKSVSRKPHLLDAQTISSLCERVVELPGGSVVSDNVISEWISAFKHKSQDDITLHHAYNSKLHPRIQAELDAVKATAQAKISVSDACHYVMENRAWGARQTRVLNSATVHDMEEIIKNSDISDMRFFMATMLDFCTHKEAYESSFKPAMDNFIQSCKNIVRSPQSGRLGKLVEHLFVESELKSLLD